jgi:hypothetical protein
VRVKIFYFDRSLLVIECMNMTSNIHLQNKPTKRISRQMIWLDREREKKRCVTKRERKHMQPANRKEVKHVRENCCVSKRLNSSIYLFRLDYYQV